MAEYGDYDNLGEDRSRSRPNLWLKIEAQVRTDRSELLTGLETWLQLDLISQAQIKKIARNHLCCPLPNIQFLPSEPSAATELSASIVPTVPTSPVPTPSFWQNIWQSWLDELSIRWLLFLGIFLVVVSSGVLAASQWQNFPDYGQYLILLLYSLGFWGIGFWTSRQSGLKLTAQTLSAIATLLIPINFWALSHLGLLTKPMGWIVVILAVITLSTTRYLALTKKSDRLATGIFLILSYLHLVWQSNLSWLAIYGGIIGIIGLHEGRFLPRRRYPLIELVFVLAAWLILLVRELIPTGNSLPSYCLAIALFFWLLCNIYLSQVKQTKLVALAHKSLALVNSFGGKIIKLIAAIALMITWWISLRAGLTQSSLFFWQNLGISCLAMQLWWQHLTLYWRRLDLTALFVLGLQALYLAKELIPTHWRTLGLNLAVNISQSSYLPESVLGVSLFPYLILWVCIASWLYRQQKRQLALYTEYLTLLLGIGFTCLSYVNPTWRSLNFALSTLTLGYVASIRLPIRTPLIYATHLLGIMTTIQAIALIFPDLSGVWWGSILIVLTGLNWGVCLTLGQRKLTPISTIINRSCWYMGLFLSAISYSCFLAAEQAAVWGLVWFTTPVMATVVAQSTRKLGQRRQATIVSCMALITAQFLVGNWQLTRIVGLAIASIVMRTNAFNLRRTSLTVLHLGFCLACFASIFSLFVPQSFNNYGQWLLIGNLALLLLYRWRTYLLRISQAPKFGYISQRSAFGILGVGRETANFKLVDKYLWAANYWAIALVALELPIVSYVYLRLPELTLNPNSFAYLLATGLLWGLLVWRYRFQPSNSILCILTWLGGIFLVSLIGLLINNTLVFAWSNLLLALVGMAIAVLIAQGDTPWAKLDLALMPLIYAVSGIFWRLSDFNASTGLLTVGAALIMLNIRPQNRQLEKSIKYLGLAAISAGVYELVIYQMQTARGGSLADALTIFSLVAAAIAFSYRIIVYWYAQQATSNIFNLSLSKITLIAHLHWAIASILKVIAAGITIETNTPRLTLVSIATSFCLGAYAIIQGRDNQKQNSTSANDWWVYVGLVEISATLVYSRLIISKLSVLDPWRIIFSCAVALLIYQIPWQNFGWRSTPWQRTAIAIPALMALVTAEDISYLGLLVTALFYLRIAYAQQNIRWSYVSLGLLNWLCWRVLNQSAWESVGISVLIGCSFLYIAQFDPDLRNHRQQRHYVRLAGSSIICLTALFQQPGILPGIISLSLIVLGLSFRVRALLYVGTVTFVLTVLHQLILLIFTYSFLKWVVGLLTGIVSIAIAAGFEQQRDRLKSRLNLYQSKLQNWQ